MAVSLPRVGKLLPCLAFFALSACVAVGTPNGSDSRRNGVTAAGSDGGVSTVDQTPTCNMACPAIDCADGMHPAPLSGDCCPTVCEPDDCSLVDCPPVECARGAHSTKPKGSCCTVCTPNASPTKGETCEQGQQGYESYRSQIMDALGASLCTEDGDCRLIVIDNPCSHDCGSAVAAHTATTLKADLNDYAGTHCEACPSSGSTCPPLERVAFCTGGVCSAH